MGNSSAFQLTGSTGLDPPCVPRATRAAARSRETNGETATKGQRAAPGIRAARNCGWTRGGFRGAEKNSAYFQSEPSSPQPRARPRRNRCPTGTARPAPGPAHGRRLHQSARREAGPERRGKRAVSPRGESARRKRVAPLAAAGSAFRPASPALPLAVERSARALALPVPRTPPSWPGRRRGARGAGCRPGPAPALRHHERHRERRRRSAAAARDAAGPRSPRGGPHGRASLSRQVSAGRTRPEGGGPTERRAERCGGVGPGGGERRGRGLLWAGGERRSSRVVAEARPSELRSPRSVMAFKAGRRR